jgi:hypothetical protein
MKGQVTIIICSAVVVASGLVSPRTAAATEDCSQYDGVYCGDYWDCESVLPANPCPRYFGCIAQDPSAHCTPEDEADCDQHDFPFSGLHFYEGWDCTYDTISEG